MSVNKLTDWPRIRIEFFDDLHDFRPRVKHKDWSEELLNFSVNADADSCYIARCLEAPVTWLKSQLNPIPIWLTVVMYDPSETDQSQVHSKHLSFDVSSDFRDKFKELQQGRGMFFLTGIPSGLAGYLPLEDFDDNKLKVLPSFPPFAMIRTKSGSDGFKASPFYNKWVCFELESGCAENIEKHFPSTWEDYLWKIIRSGVRVPEAELDDLIKHTVDIFSTDYPTTPIMPKPDEWLTLFIPGAHVKDYPFFMNGVLVSFDKPIDQSTYDILKVWTLDVCTQISNVLLLQSGKFEIIGEWRGLGRGRELRKYVDCFEHKGDGEKIISEVKAGLQDTELKNLCELKYLEDPHDLQQCVGWSRNTEEIGKYIVELKRRFPRWVVEFANTFNVSGTEGEMSALWCFVHRHYNEKNNLLLPDVIACSREAGWKDEVRISDDEKPSLLHIDYGWDLNRKSNVTPQFILKTLILNPSEKSDHETMQILKCEEDKLVWILDVKVKGERKYDEEQVISRLYLNLLERVANQQTNDLINDHSFTWMMLAATTLVEGRIMVIPEWTSKPNTNFGSSLKLDLLNSSAEECLRALGESNKLNMSWVVVGRDSSRILLYKTWDKVNPICRQR